MKTTFADRRGASEESLPLDLAFEILKNERRRMVLEELSAADGKLTLSDLSETIAARENDKTVTEISSAERKRVYVSLYQSHLPKMDKAGVLNFNKDRGVIEAGPHVDLLETYLGSPTAEGPLSQRNEWIATTLLFGLLIGLSLGFETVWGVSVALASLLTVFGLSLLLTLYLLVRA